VTNETTPTMIASTPIVTAAMFRSFVVGAYYLSTRAASSRNRSDAARPR
jgi:hypothetical protein